MIKNFAIASILLAAVAPPAHAQHYPKGPISLVIPLAPGDATDTSARAVGYAQPLFDVWAAFFAPAGVPPEVTGALVPALERAIKSPGIAAKLRPLGMLLDYAPPDKLLADMREEHRRVSEIARQAGLAK